MSSNIGRGRRRTRSASPSPARDSLMSHLGTPDANDSSLTLGKKKKSWLGGLRDAMQKGALQAKAAVDSMRSEQQKSDVKAISEEKINLEKQPQSADLTASTSNKPNHEHRLTLASRNAVSSLRNNLPHHAVKHSRGRGSIATMASTRTGSEISLLANSEKYCTSPHGDNDGEQHKRKSSLASSVVGSIRGIGRRSTKAKHATSANEPSSNPPAENIPLPSSPIDIPNLAPALELDFGPSNFMSQTFQQSPERKRAQELLAITHPMNLPISMPRMYHTHVSDSFDNTYFDNGQSSARPTDIDPHLRSLNLFGTCSTEPETPMPGTNFSLDLDGANTDRAQVFERSVTPPTAKGRKELHSMRSLDAMAEACTVAHSYDEMLHGSESTGQSNDAVQGPVCEELSIPSVRPKPCRPRIRTTSTATSCPSDMEELCRQETMEPHCAIRNFENDNTNAELIDDPFTDQAVASSGPPSPVRSVRLPFRLKVKSESVEARSLGAKETGHGGTSQQPMTARRTMNVAMDLQRKYSNAEVVQSEHGLIANEIFQEVDGPSDVDGDDDTHTRTKQLLASDIVFPDYESEDSWESGLSEHGGPLVPQVHHSLSPTETPSPRSRTTYTAGLGDAEYRFSLDNWIRVSTTPQASEGESSRARRRAAMDGSIDTVSSHWNNEIPHESEAPNLVRAQPMSDLVRRELLQWEQDSKIVSSDQAGYPAGPQTTNAISGRSATRFIVGGSGDTEADIENVNPADLITNPNESRDATPQKMQNPFSSRVGSEDSMANSLKDAACDYSRLEERLSDEDAPAGLNLPIMDDIFERILPEAESDESEAVTTITSGVSPGLMVQSKSIPARYRSTRSNGRGKALSEVSKNIV